MQEALNHDRTVHSSWVDMAWDLEKVPWPWDDDEWEEVWAFDLIEHLRLETNEFLDEAWRIIQHGGSLQLRVPSFDNHLSFRDPTHRRVYHPESFFYWDPEHHLWNDFGRYYWDSQRWWTVEFLGRENGDLRFKLVKIAT